MQRGFEEVGITICSEKFHVGSNETNRPIIMIVETMAMRFIISPNVYRGIIVGISSAGDLVDARLVLIYSFLYPIRCKVNAILFEEDRVT